jgi:DNA-directed RNA polymerase subunit RPC12/RpoP
MSDTIEHKCPSCGGSLQFDIGSQKVKCPYCGCEFDVSDLSKNEGDLSISADNIELASDAGSEWDQKEMYGMSEYQCQSCGGDIYSDENTSATMCPYCGNAVMLKGRLSGVLKPDKVLPFQKDKEQALKSLEEHCGGKRFVPKKFLDNNKLEEIKGLYVPFWVYDADLEADVTYEGVNVRTWTSGKTEYTERKYYRVRRAGNIAFDHVPADGSSKMPDDLMESLEPFDYDKAATFTTGYLSGYVADKYDLDQDAVRPRVKARMAQGAADAFGSTVKYDEVRVKSSDIKATSSHAEYVLYPVWLMNTDWDGRKFTFAMNGQTGKTVGNLPVDKAKLVSVALGIFLGIAILLSLGAYIMDPDYVVDGILGGLILGGIIAAAVYGYYKGQLKSVDFQKSAYNYYRNDSMKIEVKEDEFLYKETTSRSTD